MPCVQVVTVSCIAFNCDVAFAKDNTIIQSRTTRKTFEASHPLSAVINTRATSLLAAALAAPVKSVSLREDVTVIPDCFALAVMASTG